MKSLEFMICSIRLIERVKRSMRDDEAHTEMIEMMIETEDIAEAVFRQVEVLTEAIHLQVAVLEGVTHLQIDLGVVVTIIEGGTLSVEMGIGLLSDLVEVQVRIHFHEEGVQTRQIHSTDLETVDQAHHLIEEGQAQIILFHQDEVEVVVATILSQEEELAVVVLSDDLEALIIHFLQAHHDQIIHLAVQVEAAACLKAARTIHSNLLHLDLLVVDLQQPALTTLSLAHE